MLTFEQIILLGEEAAKKLGFKNLDDYIESKKKPIGEVQKSIIKSTHKRTSEPYDGSTFFS